MFGAKAISLFKTRKIKAYHKPKRVKDVYGGGIKQMKLKIQKQSRDKKYKNIFQTKKTK